MKDEDIKKMQKATLIICLASSGFLFLMMGGDGEMNPLRFIFCATPGIVGLIGTY